MSGTTTARESAGDHDSGASIPFGMQIDLLISDPELVAELQQFSDEQQRNEFVLRAIKVGILAIKQARGQIDVETIRNEGKQLITNLQGKLDQHSALLQNSVDSQLKHYFDPESGRLQERLQRLLKKDGELEQVLQKHLGEKDSELMRTLSAHLGKESPLLRHLDPKQSDGLLVLLQQSVDEELGVQRERILKEFSLDHKQGALSRFIKELMDQHGELSGGLTKKIDAAVSEFSLDDEHSALSRLVKNVNRAQQTISAEFSLDEEQSALSKLKRILESTQQSINSQLTLDDEDSSLSRVRRELTEILHEQQKSSREFQQEVTSTLKAMQARKEQAARGTAHGIEFEAALHAFLEFESKQNDDIVASTGNTTGNIKNCKVGDITIELGPESAAPGAKIVIEAKDKSGYQLTQAREEINTARDNRSAQVGMFVFAKNSAPEHLEPLSRIGNDVYLIWDPEQSNTDLYLKVGLTLARALCIRTQKHHDTHSADFLEVDKAILEIEKQVNSLDDIQTWGQTIANNGEKILKKVNTMRKSLGNQIETLKEKTESLKIIADS